MMVNRRHILAGTGGAVVASFAGCLSGNEADDEDPKPSADDDNSSADDSNENATSNDNSNENEAGDDQPDSIVEYGDEELNLMEFTCHSREDPVHDEPSVMAAATRLVVVGEFELPKGEDIYPRLKEITRDVDDESVTITTDFVSEVPEGQDSFEEQISGGCTADNLNLFLDFRFGIPIEEGEITEGTPVQWDIEYPDGRVDEAIATDERRPA